MRLCRIALPFLLILVWCEATPVALGALSPKVLTTGIEAAPDGERFLFVVETSAAMEDLQASNEATLYELLRGGVNGYMRSGDTYGLWTYNKEIQIGKFPMRVWDETKRLQQATVAAAFLNQLEYEKSADLKAMMANLSKVIRAVSNLTVFVVSDGGERNFGTPFDQAIAADYRKLSRERRQAKRPFVTTLVVREGWFVEAKVTISGAPIQLPQRPAPATASLRSTNSPAASATNRARSSVIAARATATNEPALTSTPITPAILKPVPAGSAPASTGISSTATVGSSSPPPVPARPKVIQIITKSNTAPDPATSSALAAETGAGSVAETPPAPLSALASNTASPSPVASTAPKPAPGAQTPPPPTIIALGSSLSPARPSASPAAPLAAPAPGTEASSVASVTVAPLPKSVENVAPAPAPAPWSSQPLTVAARERNLSVTVIGDSVAANEASNDPSQAAGATTEARKPQVMEAMVPGPGQPSGFNWMLVYGVALLGTTLILFRMVLRRLRTTTQGSIITQSMERR